MITLTTLGLHRGHTRQVARGARLTCRDYVPRWADDYLGPDEVSATLRSRFGHASEPPDLVTWVPGHDGSLGPGYFVAETLARSWNRPLVESLIRVAPLPSAHDCVRPTLKQALSSLACVASPHRTTDRLAVVDNVVASGVSMYAAITKLYEDGYESLNPISISADPTAGYQRYFRTHPWAISAARRHLRT